MEFTINRDKLIKDRVNQLKSYAKENNLKVVFRNKTTNAGDFTIFIYKPEGGRYLVGFDGIWKTWDKEFSFNHCYELAIKYIEDNRK